jgi:hypothetical protein
MDGLDIVFGKEPADFIRDRLLMVPETLDFNELTRLSARKEFFNE